MHLGWGTGRHTQTIARTTLSKFNWVSRTNTHTWSGMIISIVGWWASWWTRLIHGILKHTNCTVGLACTIVNIDKETIAACGLAFEGEWIAIGITVTHIYTPLNVSLGEGADALGHTWTSLIVCILTTRTAHSTHTRLGGFIHEIVMGTMINTFSLIIVCAIGTCCGACVGIIVDESTRWTRTTNHAILCS